MKINKLISIFICMLLLLTLGLTGCSSGNNPAAPATPATSSGSTAPAAPAQTYSMDVSCMFSYPDPLCYTLDDFKANVEKKTGGRIEVNLFFDGVLGNGDEENALMVAQNSVQMSTCPMFTLASLNPELTKFCVIDAPYVLQSTQELNAFGDSDIFASMLDELLEKTDNQVRGYRIWNIGWTLVGSNKPLHTLQELNGHKIRAAPNTVRLQALNYYGAIVTVIPFGEVYTALQQGTVDGASTSLPYWKSNRFAEVVKYVLHAKHSLNTHMPIVNNTWYSSLPADLQKILDECIDELTDATRIKQQEFEDEVFDYCREHTTFSEATVEQMQVYSEDLRYVQTEFADLMGGEEFIAETNAWFAEWRKNNPV